MTASPFPGMNPYLEEPALWSGVQHRLITAVAIALAPAIRPKYFVAVEERVYQSLGEDLALVGTPDDSIVRSTATRSPTLSTIPSTASSPVSQGQAPYAPEPISTLLTCPTRFQSFPFHSSRKIQNLRSTSMLSSTTSMTKADTISDLTMPKIPLLL